jgi:predicted Zn-dependent protease
MARAELRARNPAGAEAVLRPLLDANPEDHHIGELLVQALIDGRKGSEAAALAQRIIKKRPKRAVYRVLLGDAYRASGAMNAARAAWREALELEPDNKEALRRLNAP